MRTAALLLAAALATVTVTVRAARAQPVADPIGALLDHPDAPLSRDQDEPDVAGQKVTPEPEPAPMRISPAAPAPQPAAPPPRPQLNRPVHLDETGKTPDGPPSVRDMAYDTRIKSSFLSAESFQGPLDGGWTLAAGATDLYALQLVDRTDRLEGAWRDLRRPGAIGASGLVDDMQRSGGELTLRFVSQPNAPPVVAVLRRSGDGRWAGDLTEGGETRRVVLRRSSP